MNFSDLFEIIPGENVLVCEDVITTGGSVQEVIDIVNQFNGAIVGVGAIVDRSGGKAQFHNFFPTLRMDVIAYQPNECPLCKQEIPVEKPGSRVTSRT